MQPAPQSEIEEIHNQLIEAPHFDQVTLARLCWRLKGLRNKRPGDFKVRASLAHALLRLGRREEAIEEAKVADGLKNPAVISAYSLLASTWAGLGDYSRAGDLFRDIMALRGWEDERVCLSSLCHISANIGDMDAFMPLTDSFPVQFIEVLKNSGLDKHFHAHMDIVNRLVTSLQCWGQIDFLDEEDDLPMISFVRYLKADNRECIRMQMELTRLLGEYYESQGLPPGIYIPHLHVSLEPMPVADEAAVA